MIKVFAFAALISFMSFVKKHGVVEQQKYNPVITIDFQYGFKPDTVDVEINNVLIVHHILLTSSFIGFTALSLKVDSASWNQYKINYLDKVKYCNRSPTIELNLKLNGKTFVYNLDPRNGKWVGFGKDVNNTLTLLQQHGPFIYE